MRRRLAAAAVLAVSLGGCGGPAADLFVVQRSGSIPGARLSLRVSDDGFVRCDGGKRQAMGDSALLKARQLARDLDDIALETLPPGPRSVLRYRIRVEAGNISLSDSSPRQRKALAQLQA